MKNKVFEATLIFAVIFFAPQLSVSADIYKWTDDEGVVHVTDDPTNIPDKYWEQEKVKKEEVKPAPETKPAQPVKPSPAPKTEKIELYGDYPLDWWTYKFRELRKNIADNEQRIETEKSFISVFEGGRRYGKIFTDEEISQYESYQAEVPVLEEKVQKLKDELEELQRKATLYGVPRSVRE